MGEGFNINVDLSDLRRLAKRFPELVEEEATKTMTLIAGALEADVVAKTPRGIGGGSGLAGSIAGEVVRHGTSISTVVGTPFLYGEVVEVGRRPGSMPPTGPIALWAQKKLGIEEKSATGVAFAIAMKIKKEGTKGAHMFEDTLKARDGWIINELVGIAGRVAKRANNRE